MAKKKKEIRDMSKDQLVDHIEALKKAAIDGDIENGSVMAGQSIGLIKKEQSLSEIIEEFVIQADARYK